MQTQVETQAIPIPQVPIPQVTIPAIPIPIEIIIIQTELQIIITIMLRIILLEQAVTQAEQDAMTQIQEIQTQTSSEMLMTQITITNFRHY